jgi:S-adenosylmethionine synthetase
MDLCLSDLEGAGAGAGGVEVVERKGLGHPDTLCDALAEEFSRSLCRFQLDRFGAILHHNVDKVLLWGGAARPAFGGGAVLAPFEVFLSGRASDECEGVRVPVEELAVEGSRAVLGQRLHALDVEKHVQIHCLVRPGASELVHVHRRALANDTSCGVGYAPLSDLERVVLGVERELSSAWARRARPEVGEDVKVMGVRRGERIHLTIACAFVGRHCADLADYLARKHEVAELAREAARRETALAVEVELNTGDDPERGSVYLTVTGTSAESGDDGEAGRGNRVNGLITPYRPMTMESAAGKNPVTHVGKLYNLAAGLVAASLVDELPGVVEAECRLVSQIGRPVRDPQIADVRLRCAKGVRAAAFERNVAEIVRRHLDAIDAYARELVEGSLGLDRWPLRP